MNINTEGVEFGQIVRDVVTGFTGAVTGVSAYVTGCAQALVTPRIAKEGEVMQESRWIDVGRLKRTGVDDEVAALAAPRPAATRGGDIPAPVK